MIRNVELAPFLGLLSARKKSKVPRLLAELLDCMEALPESVVLEISVPLYKHSLRGGDALSRIVNVHPTLDATHPLSSSRFNKEGCHLHRFPPTLQMSASWASLLSETVSSSNRDRQS